MGKFIADKNLAWFILVNKSAKNFCTNWDEKEKTPTHIWAK